MNKDILIGIAIGLYFLPLVIGKVAWVIDTVHEAWVEEHLTSQHWWNIIIGGFLCYVPFINWPVAFLLWVQVSQNVFRRQKHDHYFDHR